NRRAPRESAQFLPATQSVMIRRTCQTFSQLQRSDRDQRPMTYTTVNTTIHTTSTKCQSIDNVQTLRVQWLNGPQKRENHNYGQQDQTDDHMESMQPNQGIVGRTE